MKGGENVVKITLTIENGKLKVILETKKAATTDTQSGLSQKSN